jgi:hypothetical protein
MKTKALFESSAYARLVAPSEKDEASDNGGY